MIHDIVARFGSPLYVYDAQSVRAAWQRFTQAFTYQPVEFHYAIVCNKNRHLVTLLHGLGAGVHANTPGDAYAALMAGVAATQIVYSGTNLNADDFAFLIERGIGMNLDSLDQLRDLLQLCAPTQLGLRVAVDDEATTGRIGVSTDELDEAVRLARITGLHIYAGTNTRSVERFVACVDRLIAASDRLPDLDYIDIGGGFGVDYHQQGGDIDLPALGAAVTERMQALSARRGRRIRLLVEPGRYLVAQAGTLVATVVSVKERAGRRYVGVDTTVGNIVVPSVYHAHHQVHALSPRGDPLDIATDVCGNTTHSRDFIGRNLRLPHLQPGDLIAVADVGAYGYAMSSHFLNRPRPAEVIVDGAQVRLTTRRETFADLVATQL